MWRPALHDDPAEQVMSSVMPRARSITTAASTGWSRPLIVLAKAALCLWPQTRGRHVARSLHLNRERSGAHAINCELLLSLPRLAGRI